MLPAPCQELCAVEVGTVSGMRLEVLAHACVGPWCILCFCLAGVWTCGRGFLFDACNSCYIAIATSIMLRAAPMLRSSTCLSSPALQGQHSPLQPARSREHESSIPKVCTCRMEGDTGWNRGPHVRGGVPAAAAARFEFTPDSEKKRR